MYLSKKSMGISESPTLAIDAKYKAMKAEGQDVIGFGAGEPDFDTPDHIKQAAIDAINDGFTKYTPAAGTVELKKAICAKLEKENGLIYKPNQIVVSNGAKHSLVNAFSAILNPGDEVIIPAPYWVSYPEMVKIADGVPVTLMTTEENGFRFTIDEMRAAITPKTRAIIINSPSNPTGMMYTEDDLRQLAELAVEKNIYVVSDEIYEHLIYDGGRHTSIASFGEEIQNLTITVNGVSKSYSMTGWRIGYTASAPEIAKIMSNVQSHATSNPCSISQKAALAAISGPQDQIKVMRAEFQKRRDYMVSRINAMDGVSCLKPEGAFYTMMNISKLIGKVAKDADDLCAKLLDDVKLALVPGTGFEAPNYVRWSYATSMENIEKGLDRLEQFLR